MEANTKKVTFSDEELGQIRETSDEFFDLTGSVEGGFVNKTLFFKVFLALLISIPSIGIFDILALYNKKEENDNKKEENDAEKEENDSGNKENDSENKGVVSGEPEKLLEKYYRELMEVPQKGFKSNRLEARIRAKSAYYEEALRLRILIQNYDYNWRELNKTAANFMLKREIIKTEMEQLGKYGIGEYQCFGCNTKWLKTEKSECLRCRADEAIKLYVVIANYFQVIGDMDQFYANLDNEVKEKLFDPKRCQQYHDYFQRQQHNRSLKLNNQLYREYGLKQYKYLVKKEGHEEIDADEELKEFNRKYDLALTRLDEVLDLREAKNSFQVAFVEDLSLIEFQVTKKVIFPPKKVDLNAFKPKMPMLEEIVAIDCQIKQLELDVKFFPKLWRLNLEENKIEQYLDIYNLKNLPKLKKIELSRNPIEKTNEIYKAKNSFKKEGIEVIFSPQLMYRYKRDIEDESDEEIKEDMLKFKDLYEKSESEPSLSDLDELLKDKPKKK
jgi:hypothetical protein